MQDNLAVPAKRQVPLRLPPANGEEVCSNKVNPGTRFRAAMARPADRFDWKNLKTGYYCSDRPGAIMITTLTLRLEDSRFLNYCFFLSDVSLASSWRARERAGSSKSCECNFPILLISRG